MNGLDNRGVEDIRKLLLDLKAEGKTIVIASHSMEDIHFLCDTVHEMDAGVLTPVREAIKIEKKQALRHKPKGFFAWVGITRPRAAGARFL